MKGITFSLPPAGLITQSVTLWLPIYLTYAFLRVDGRRLGSTLEYEHDVIEFLPNDAPNDSGKVFGENQVSHVQLDGTIAVKSAPDVGFYKASISETGYVTGYKPRGRAIASVHHPYWADNRAVAHTALAGKDSYDARNSKGTGIVYEYEWALTGNTLFVRRRRVAYVNGKLYAEYAWYRQTMEIPKHSLSSTTMSLSTTSYSTNESTGATSSESELVLIAGNEPMPSMAFARSQFDLLSWRTAIHTYGLLADIRYVEDLEYDLTKSACENVASLDVNNLESLSALRDLSSLLPSKGKTAIKTISGLYLWYKYVFSTTKSDLSSIWKAKATIAAEISRNPKFLALRSQEHRSYELPVGAMTVDYYSKVVLENSKVSILNKVMNALDSLGLAPTTANVWAILPFSFIVDWFTGIGPLLEDVDQWVSQETSRYPLRVRTYSSRSKVVLALDPVAFGWALNADITFTRFVRKVSTRFPKNRFEFGRTNPTSHIFELIALVIANWKH